MQNNYIASILLFLYLSMALVEIYVTDIDWKQHCFTMDSDAPVSIVDLAEEHGIELPYSCRSGACFSCCGRVTEWQEYIDPNKTGEQLIDVDADETLCCISWVCSSAFQDDTNKTIRIEMLN